MVDIHTKLEDAIYEIICDYNFFKIGDVLKISEIYEIVIPQIQKIDKFKFTDIKLIKHSTRQVMQTRNNSIRNTNYKKYYAKRLIKRDIGSIICSYAGEKHYVSFVFGSCFPSYLAQKKS